MPKAMLQKENDRCLYDPRLSWAARGLMMSLINYEQNEGEIVFPQAGSSEWHEVNDILQILELYDYIRIEGKGLDDFNIFIL